MNQIKKDFRSGLYNKYVTTFKEYIEVENNASLKSEHNLYKRWYLPLIKEFTKDAAIIDIGCGSGLMLQFLKQEGFQNLFGIDISEQQIKRANNKGLNAEVYDIFNFIKITNKKFDVIFALDIVEHFYKEELIDLFSGLYHLLNEKGILIIHTPNGDGIYSQHIIYGDLTHLTIFNPNSLGQILRLTGFNEIKCCETGPTSKNIKGFVRLILWKVIKLIVSSVRIIEQGGTEKILTQDFICSAYKKSKIDV